MKNIKAKIKPDVNNQDELILYWAKQLEHISLSLHELVENGKWLIQHYQDKTPVIKKNKTTVKKSNYFDDLEKWENSFSCGECGETEKKNFYYSRTVANGEVWTCKHCKKEALVNNRPKEDNY